MSSVKIKIIHKWKNSLTKLKQENTETVLLQTRLATSEEICNWCTRGKFTQEAWDLGIDPIKLFVKKQNNTDPEDNPTNTQPEKKKRGRPRKIKIDENQATVSVNKTETSTKINLFEESPLSIADSIYDGAGITADTVNYRTYQPEIKGLFCDYYFGPTEGARCPSCGWSGFLPITLNTQPLKCPNVNCSYPNLDSPISRRGQMGYIKLATPCIHPWYASAWKSPLSTCLGIDTKLLELIFDFQVYLVNSYKYYDYVIQPIDLILLPRFSRRLLINDKWIKKSRKSFRDPISWRGLIWIPNQWKLFYSMWVKHENKVIDKKKQKFHNQHKLEEKSYIEKFRRLEINSNINSILLRLYKKTMDFKPFISTLKLTKDQLKKLRKKKLRKKQLNLKKKNLSLKTKQNKKDTLSVSINNKTNQLLNTNSLLDETQLNYFDYFEKINITGAYSLSSLLKGLPKNTKYFYPAIFEEWTARSKIKNIIYNQIQIRQPSKHLITTGRAKSTVSFYSKDKLKVQQVTKKHSYLSHCFLTQTPTTNWNKVFSVLNKIKGIHTQVTLYQKQTYLPFNSYTNLSYRALWRSLLQWNIIQDQNIITISGVNLNLRRSNSGCQTQIKLRQNKTLISNIQYLFNSIFPIPLKQVTTKGTLSTFLPMYTAKFSNIKRVYKGVNHWGKIPMGNVLAWKLWFHYTNFLNPYSSLPIGYPFRYKHEQDSTIKTRRKKEKEANRFHLFVRKILKLQKTIESSNINLLNWPIFEEIIKLNFYDPKILANNFIINNELNINIQDKNLSFTQNTEYQFIHQPQITLNKILQYSKIQKKNIQLLNRPFLSTKDTILQLLPLRSTKDTQLSLKKQFSINNDSLKFYENMTESTNVEKVTFNRKNIKYISKLEKVILKSKLLKLTDRYTRRQIRILKQNFPKEHLKLFTVPLFELDLDLDQIQHWKQSHITIVEKTHKRYYNSVYFPIFEEIVFNTWLKSKRNYSLPIHRAIIRKFLVKGSYSWIRRYRLLRNLERGIFDPEGLIIKSLPILPPPLRPIIRLRIGKGKISTSDVNHLYRTVILRNIAIHKYFKNRLELNIFDLHSENNSKDPILEHLSEKEDLKPLSVGFGPARPIKDVLANYMIIHFRRSLIGVIENSKLRQTAFRILKPTPEIVINSFANPIPDTPLVTLADALKGKFGLLRRHILGKRADYSGRTVIVSGPELSIEECGLPYDIAFGLFRPFLIHTILRDRITGTIGAAKRLLKSSRKLTYYLLETIVDQHPIVLNRAPTLHRIGIQSFTPVLISGFAVQLHPLVCPPFNADFDGDTIAIHLPLSYAARAEAHIMISGPVFPVSPANGDGSLLPSQDIVLGCFALTNYKGNDPLQGLGQAQLYPDSLNIINALEQSIIATATTGWIPWKYPPQTEIENAYPIELRIQRSGIYYSIYNNYVYIINSKGQLVFSLTNTTPGFALIQRALTSTLL